MYIQFKWVVEFSHRSASLVFTVKVGGSRPDWSNLIMIELIASYHFVKHLPGTQITGQPPRPPPASAHRQHNARIVKL